MTVYEIGDDRIVVDAGMSFPRDEHLGVDLILPDFGYLHDKRIRGRRAHACARGSRRRAAVPDARGAHRGDLGDAADPRARQVEARRARAAARGGAARGRSGGRAVDLGPFGSSSSAWRIRSRCVAIALETARGRIFHTGDWKLDHTPVDGLRTDVGRLAELGNRGVDLLLGNRGTPSVRLTRSERVVGEAFRQIIPQRRGRVLVSSFASNIHRMQQAIDVCDRHRPQGRRRRAFDARATSNVARNLGYVNVPAACCSSSPLTSTMCRAGGAADPLHRLAG